MDFKRKIEVITGGAQGIGLLIGGEVGDKYGRKYVIWVSILGSSPFALLLPYCDLTWTIILVINTCSN